MNTALHSVKVFYCLIFPKIKRNKSMKFYSELSSDLRYIMKITLSQLIIVLVMSSISYAAPSKAQGVLNSAIRINEQRTSLQAALGKLEQLAGIKFVYSKNLIDVD